MDAHVKARYGLLIRDRIAVCDGDPFQGAVPAGFDLGLGEVNVLPPCVPAKFIGLWNNYHALAEKLGQSIPAEPLYFLKATSSLLGDGGVIRLPRGYSGRVAYEGELGIVIGRRCTNADETEAAGAALAAVLAPGAVAGLAGALGACKTCFGRGRAARLGVDPTLIASPTFVYLVDYPGSGLVLHHADLYRLTEVPDARPRLRTKGSVCPLPSLPAASPWSNGGTATAALGRPLSSVLSFSSKMPSIETSPSSSKGRTRAPARLLSLRSSAPPA